MNQTQLQIRRDFTFNNAVTFPPFWVSHEITFQSQAEICGEFWIQVILIEHLYSPDITYFSFNMLSFAYVHLEKRFHFFSIFVSILEKRNVVGGTPVCRD